MRHFLSIKSDFILLHAKTFKSVATAMIRGINELLSLLRASFQRFHFCTISSIPLARMLMKGALMKGDDVQKELTLTPNKNRP